MKWRSFMKPNTEMDMLLNEMAVYKAELASGPCQNVILSDTEQADLQAEFPDLWQQCVERLSEYMASTGKRYPPSNHCLFLPFSCFPKFTTVILEGFFERAPTSTM